MMEAHGKRIFSLCLRMCGDYFQAEDLAQETFLAAYGALDRFDGQNEAAWLTRIASRKCLDYLRRAAARKQTDCGEEAWQAFAAPERESTEAVYFDRHWAEALRRACEALREPYGGTALAYYCEGKALTQLARESETPLATVRTRVHRARQMLQAILKEEMRL